MVKYNNSNDSNYSNDTNSNYNSNNGNIGSSLQQGKQYSKAKKKQNKYYSQDKNGNLDSVYSSSNGLGLGLGIEAFTADQSQFLQSPEMQSGMNLGQSMPNPYQSSPSNQFNSRNITIQDINSQIQKINNPSANDKKNENDLTYYSQQSEAVLAQNQLTDREMHKLMKLTGEYNNLVAQYDNVQNTVMTQADNQVLSRNTSTNPYLNSYVQLPSGDMYYVTNAGIAQPYSLTDPNNTTPLPSNVQTLSNVTANNDYINTTPMMQIGVPKLQSNSSGYEGTNVYVNNSQMNTITDASYIGCLNTNPSIQPSIMTSAPNSDSGNYTFQTCQTAAYDSGSNYFSFNLVNVNNSTGNCFLTNDASSVIMQGPSLNYTDTALWNANLQNVTGASMVGNYMGVTSSGSVGLFNSSNSQIWSSDACGNNTTSASNYVGCYNSNLVQSQQVITGYNTVPGRRICFGWFGCFTIGGGERTPIYGIDYSSTPLMTTVTNANNNTWESCYQYAYDNSMNYFGVRGYNPANGMTTCLVGDNLKQITFGGGSQNCPSNDDINYGATNTNAVYSANNTPTNAFLTLNDDGLVTAFIGLNLNDIQTITWQLDMSGQMQTSMPNYNILNSYTYMGSMQTGQTLQEGQILCSPNALLWFTVENGNLVLYTSSNTPKCSLMNSNGNEYYAGDASMNSLYQMNSIGNPSVLGNIGYIDDNSTLYPYPQNLVGQDVTFTYMGNYDTSGTIVPYTDPTSNYTSIYYTGLDLSGSMQKCIDLSCNAFVLTILANIGSTQVIGTKFMSKAFATPFTNGTYPRFPNSNSQLYIRNPTVNNSQYCNKSITGINSGLYNNYKTKNTPMDANMQCVKLTTTNGNGNGNTNGTSATTTESFTNANVNSQELNDLSNQINTLASKISKQLTSLQNKTLTVNQQQQLNEIVLNKQFRKIDEHQNREKQYQKADVTARNIKNDSDLIVLKENQGFILWSVLAISVALITIHVIR